MTILAIALLLSSAAVEATTTAPAADPAPLRGPIKMKASQIREYNKGLAKDHPAYIRCEGQAVTGSLAARNKVCRTNQEWARLDREGNAAARGLVDGMSKGWTTGDVPPSGDIRPGT